MSQCIRKPGLECTGHLRNVIYANFKVTWRIMDRGKIQAVRKKQIREPDLRDLIQFVEKLFMSIQKILNKTTGN